MSAVHLSEEIRLITNHAQGKHLGQYEQFSDRGCTECTRKLQDWEGCSDAR